MVLIKTTENIWRSEIKTFNSVLLTLLSGEIQSIQYLGMKKYRFVFFFNFLP